MIPTFASAQTSLKATVSFLEGKAVALDAKGVERPLKTGDAIREGEKIRLTTKKSRVVLKVSDGTELRMRGKTQVGFTEFNRSTSGMTRKTRLELAWGNVWAKVTKLTNKSSRFEVKAGGVICGVRGTTLAGEKKSENSRTGSFANIEGVIFVDDGNGPIMVPEGMGVDFGENGLGNLAPYNPSQFHGFNFGGGGDGGEGGGDANGDDGTGGNGQGVGGGNDGQGGGGGGMDGTGGGLDDALSQGGETGREGFDNQLRSNDAIGLDFTVPEGLGGGEKR
jgi:hypothetical protein